MTRPPEGTGLNSRGTTLLFRAGPQVRARLETLCAQPISGPTRPPYNRRLNQADSQAGRSGASSAVPSTDFHQPSALYATVPRLLLPITANNV